MEIRTLKGIGVDKITETFNTAFANYFIPLQLTSEQLLAKFRADRVDLDLSVGTFYQGRLAAFILHGFDVIDGKQIVYNGGTGVVPSARGQHLTQRMYQFVLPILLKKGAHKVVLEVITKNTQAIRSYEKTGFKVVRELSCYKGEVALEKPVGVASPKNLKYYPWENLEVFWDTLPTWQNAKNVLDHKPNNTKLGVYHNGKLVGYISFDPNSHRIQQLAVHKDFRKRGIASRMVWELKEIYGRTVSVINVDKQNMALHTFFLKMGLDDHLSQYEMELVLNPKS